MTRDTTLRSRLATIIQEGHVNRRTSDEVAEMVMLECRRENPELDDALVALLAIREHCPADPDLNPC